MTSDAALAKTSRIPQTCHGATAPARAARFEAWAVLVLALVLGAPFVLSAGSSVPGAGSGATLDERWMFDELNARRRAHRLPALAWDATAYTAAHAGNLLSLARAARGSYTLAARVDARRGYKLAWAASLGHADEFRDAVELALDGPLLADPRYTHAAVALEHGENRTAAALYLCEQRPLLGRALLNGPAGAYRVRCPACRREALYALKAPRGYVSIACSTCGTHMTPWIEDRAGALHWPSEFLRPFAPFATSNPFLAWQWVNERVAYDHPKADRDLPGWQWPDETARRRSGVCRDTALLLAAWLRSLGKRAWVVTGLAHGQPHAWVVLEQGGTRYLLETAHDGALSGRMPPRLELASDYLPTEMIFDEQSVRLNRGQQRLRDYDNPSVWLAVEEAP